MKKISVIMAALAAASVLLASCGSGHPETTSSVPAPASHGGVSIDTSWRLIYQASCLSGSIEKCRGAYGFSVNGDGSYQVGPGPDHEVLVGHLEGSEYQVFLDLIGKFHVADFAIAARAPEKCIQAATGPADSIQLAYHEASHGVVRVTGSDVCFDGAFVASNEDAHIVQNWLSAIVNKYYPVSFPNPCVSAATSLEQSYGDLTRCDQDADCAYLDINYLPANDPKTPVIVDDCTQIQTLPVANAFAAVSSQRELLLERELAKKVCGGQLMKTSCGQIVQFVSGSAPPVCVEGVCRINPRVQMR